MRPPAWWESLSADARAFAVWAGAGLLLGGAGAACGVLFPDALFWVLAAAAALVLCVLGARVLSRWHKLARVRGTATEAAEAFAAWQAALLAFRETPAEVAKLRLIAARASYEKAAREMRSALDKLGTIRRPW